MNADVLGPYIMNTDNVCPEGYGNVAVVISSAYPVMNIDFVVEDENGDTYTLCARDPKLSSGNAYRYFMEVGTYRVISIENGPSNYTISSNLGQIAPYATFTVENFGGYIVVNWSPIE